MPQSITTQLDQYGQATVDARREGRPITDPRFGWENFQGPVHMAMFNGDRRAIVQELYDAVAASPQRELATLGAYRLLAEFDPQLDDPHYLLMHDASLEYLRSLGFLSGHLTLYERQRWVATHGELRSSFDNIFEVGVPDVDDAPEPKPLAIGEERVLARHGPPPDGNAFVAEHRRDGTYVVHIEGPWSVDDPRIVRSEDPFLGPFTALPDLLRAFGSRLGARPYWADEDLESYFPLRRA